ncbi:MAG: CAP domain-containing protein [Verrucomicrobiota bacterium]
MNFLLIGIILICGSVCRADISGEVLQEMNRARENPKAYAQVIAGEGTHASSQKSKAAIQETITFLEKSKPLPPLTLCPSLVLSAQAHVDDTGSRGITGHKGSDRSDPHRRMSRYGKVVGYGGENISYGYPTAQSIVISLIIDEGVSDRGHRRNIFNPNFKLAGVATGKHASYGIMCVTDFATIFIPRGEIENTPLFR